MKFKKFLALFLFIFAFQTPSYAQSGATQSYKPEGFWMLRKKGKDGRYYNHSKIRVYKSDVIVPLDSRGNEVFDRANAVTTGKKTKLFAKLIEYYPNKTAKCCSDARYSDKENYPEHYTSLANQPLRGILLFKNLSRNNSNELVWEGKAKTSNYVWFQKMENLVGIDDSEENQVGILNPENGRYNSVKVTFTKTKDNNGNPKLQMRISNYGLLPTWFNSQNWLWDWFVTDDVWEKVR